MKPKRKKLFDKGYDKACKDIRIATLGKPENLDYSLEAYAFGRQCGYNEAREQAAKIASGEWKKHTCPQLKDPSENAELTSLRIRDKICAMKPEEDK